MTIQFNTDKTIHGDKRQQDYFSAQIAKELEYFQSHITRVEAHLTDENGNKPGVHDIRCLLEARLEGRKPVAVSNQADTIEKAVTGAVHKLKTSLQTTIEKIRNY